MNFVKKFVVLPSNYNAMKKVVDNLKSKNITPIFDYALEHSGKNNFNEVKKEIENVTGKFSNNFAALKISAFDISRNNEDIVNDCLSIINTCKYNNTCVTIDAEQVKYQEKISNITNSLIQKNTDIYKTYQMYRKDSLELLQNDINMCNEFGLTLNIKLVRGAYYIQDKKTNVLCDNIEQTHSNYNEGIKIIINEMKQNKNMKAIIATHNTESMNLLKTLISEDNMERIHFAHLMGFLDNTSNELSKEGYNVMKYVPFGPILKTYPYLLRRLIENYELTRFI